MNTEIKTPYWYKGRVIQQSVEYTMFAEAWTPEDKSSLLDEAVFADYVINEHDENDLHEWIMRLIGNFLGEYNFQAAETVEEFKALALKALKDKRAN